MKVKFKKLHKDAWKPSYAKPGDAGLDLVAISMEEGVDDIITYNTGLAVEIPEGYVGLLFPRSSIYKQDIDLANSVGVIDSGYRGEIKFNFRLVGNKEYAYQPTYKIGQLIIIPYPQIELEEVEELSTTDRGDGGFGSSGA